MVNYEVPGLLTRNACHHWQYSSHNYVHYEVMYIRCLSEFAIILVCSMHTNTVRFIVLIVVFVSYWSSYHRPFNRFQIRKFAFNPSENMTGKARKRAKKKLKKAVQLRVQSSSRSQTIKYYSQSLKKGKEKKGGS